VKPDDGLTPQEKNDIKDDIWFKANTTLILKSLKGLPRRVDSLETHRTLQWFLLSGIIVSILTIPFWALK